MVIYIDELTLPDTKSRFATVTERIADLLGCSLDLVDVLASRLGYVAYSVFDCDGPVNQAALAAVTFDAEDEDAVLCGPVLIIDAE